MLKIYYNERLIDKWNYVPFLNPFLWNPVYDDKYDICFYDSKQINKRTEIGKNFIELTSLSDCDYVVYPKFFYFDLLDELKKEAKNAESLWKKVIVFYPRDVEIPINVQNTIIFRCSLCKSFCNKKQRKPRSR